MTAGTRRPVPDDQFGGRLSGCWFLDLEVSKVIDRIPRLRTITFASSDLVGFQWRAGQDLMFRLPSPNAVVNRRYTIRRSNPEEGTLDIEVVLHSTGPFAAWAATAAIGAHIEAIGPRGTIGLRDGADHHLFIGDESAIAVTFALVEALPAQARATVVIGLVGGASEPPIPVTRANVDVSWVPVANLVDSLRSLSFSEGTVAYLNGERSQVREAAGVLTDRGIAPEAIATKAYWRRDRANASHGEPQRAS